MESRSCNRICKLKKRSTRESVLSLHFFFFSSGSLFSISTYYSEQFYSHVRFSLIDNKTYKQTKNRLNNLTTTNKTLTDFNIFSEEKYASVAPELSKLAKSLKTIKNDLDYIYKKTRYFLALGHYE